MLPLQRSNMAKKPRNKARLKLARQAIDRTAESLERAGISQRRVVIRLGGQRPQRWKPPEPAKS